jgi:hypothetical protein
MGQEVAAGIDVATMQNVRSRHPGRKSHHSRMNEPLLVVLFVDPPHPFANFAASARGTCGARWNQLWFVECVLMRCSIYAVPGAFSRLQTLR